MIFLTVGTEKFPLDRLLKAVDEAVGNKKIDQAVFGQIGKSGYKPQWFSYKEFFEFAQMKKFIQEAEIVVSHAGIGSTLLCLNLEKIPILFPRRLDFGEHLDNHQVEFAKKIEAVGKVLVAYDEKDLMHKILNYQKLVSQLKLQSVDVSRDGLINHLKEICA